MSKNISVILACLNFDKSCQLSIDSVIKSNSINNLFKELVVVIGSRKDSKKILEKYKYLHNKNFIIKVEISRNGIYAAYNSGLKIATGEYLLFIGAGEEINSEISFLRELKKHKFPLIIIDFPDPYNLHTAKLYTRQFYELVKSILSPNGVLALQSTSPLFNRKSFLCIGNTLLPQESCLLIAT